MPNKSRFAIAKEDIRRHFKNNNLKAFRPAHLDEILEEKRIVWNLPHYMDSSKFIDRLVRENILSEEEILFSGYLQDKKIYLREDANIFEIANSLINKSYLSHYTALYLNGLTTQVPKTIYITFEQGRKVGSVAPLKQQAIDNAFKKEQRRSNTMAEFKGYRFVIHNGKFCNRIGVQAKQNISVSNVERTLIDITVRPDYAGGVFSVLEAYKNAINEISVNKMIGYLNNIKYIYPYHQAIGFYLEKAGYKGEKLKDLRDIKMEYDFYLTYNMKEMDYSNKWHIYYPKGM